MLDLSARARVQKVNGLALENDGISKKFYISLEGAVRFVMSKTKSEREQLEILLAPRDGSPARQLSVEDIEALYSSLDVPGPANPDMAFKPKASAASSPQDITSPMKLHSIIYEGHAPGAVRDAFLEAVDHMSEMGAIGLKLILLCRQLRECTDPLPGVTCQVLGIPAGSTYGCGAAALLEQGEQLPNVRG